MNTSEALEKLKIPSKFELLATAVLCKINRNYQAIMHSGLNAEGETRRSPVDGFLRVPNSNPPHYILVEHTIAKDLKDKWLLDHRTVTPSKKGRKNKLSESDDGDLLKAAQLSSTYKAEFPDAIFTVVLTTNQRLQPELCLEVEKKAQELGVLVEFLEGSSIARYLNIEPDGQWLRKEYLGIEAEMLSEELLCDLCEKSLNKYQRQRDFLTSPDRWVSRHIDQQVEKAVENQNCSMSLLIGNSGSGKSAAAYQVGKKNLEAGGYSLWLSEDALGSSDFLENALDKALHDLYPSLMSDAGNAALKLLKDGKRLLLIADDVNRTNSPANLLQKLINWSKPFSSQDPNTKVLSSQPLLICPIGRDTVNQLYQDIDEIDWINSVFIGTMTPEEGATAMYTSTSINGIEITNVEASILANKLANDPLLISLFELQLEGYKSSELLNLTEDTVKKFIDKELSKISSAIIRKNEYYSALLKLTTQMLQRKKLNPLLSEINDWFGKTSEELLAIRNLEENGKLCRFEEEGSIDKLVFRHDRIREFLFVESMGQLLKENVSKPLDIFWEPYYAEIIGQAIIQYPQSKEFLQELCDRLALALVESIPYFSTPPNDYHHKIINILKNWIEREVINDSVPKSVVDTIYWRLKTIDSPFVLQITENVSPSLSVLTARFRNGCTTSGVHFLIYFLQNVAVLSVIQIQDSLWNQAIAQAKHYHKSKILQELKKLLVDRSKNDVERRSALALTGFLCFPNLNVEIQTCWEISQDKSETLPEAIWAIIQCNIDHPYEFLDQLFKYWNSLQSISDDSGDPKRFKRNSIISSFFKSALKNDQHKNIISYLINQANKYKSLYLDILFVFLSFELFNTLELEALEFSFRYLASHPHIQNSNRLLILNSQLKLSPASRQILKTIWTNTNNDVSLRKITFYYWGICINQNDLDSLRIIKSDFPSYESVLWKRALLSDFSIVPDILPLLSKDINWLKVAHYIWCDELINETKNHLQRLTDKISNDSFSENTYEIEILCDLLTIIPELDAENLLEEYWSYLGCNSRFIQTAIYVGTPKCLSLAKSSIEKCPDNILIFKNCSYNFHLSYDNKQEYLSKDKLERLTQNLLQYIDLCDELDILYLAKACKKFGLIDFSKCLTLKLTDEFRKGVHPSHICYHTENELLEELKKFLSSDDGINELTIWLERYEMKHELKPSVISKFILAHPTIQGIQIAAKCLEFVGNRKDISILDNLKIEAPLDELEKIKSSLQFAIYRRTLD